jgi:hypothetical protein
MTQLPAAIVLVQVPPVPVQASVVQIRPSSQVVAPQQMLPMQAPLVHPKPVVHALPLGSLWQIPLFPLLVMQV